MNTLGPFGPLIDQADRNQTNAVLVPVSVLREINALIEELRADAASGQRALQDLVDVVTMTLGRAVPREASAEAGT